MTPRIVQRAERMVRSLERELRSTYGWTLLDVTVEARGLALVVKGTVPVMRIARRLTAALADDLPTGWYLDPTRLVPLRTDRWSELPLPITPLWQKLPSMARLLSTELSREDGPVEILAEHEGCRLVRAMDGTVGWIEGDPGTPVGAPVIKPAHGTADAVIVSARRYVDAPYLLGGTTERGLDCSALVQCAFRAGLGVILPRHSTDQLAAIWRGDEQPKQTGDLVFTWSNREGPCHVGVLVDAGESSVIHASLSRRRVVEDQLDRFIRETSRVELVPLPSILAYHEHNLGRPALELSELLGPAD